MSEKIIIRFTNGEEWNSNEISLGTALRLAEGYGFVVAEILRDPPGPKGFGSLPERGWGFTQNGEKPINKGWGGY